VVKIFEVKSVIHNDKEKPDEILSVLVFGLMLVLLTACGESEPPYTDNGNPGQIQGGFLL
jgi:hypothetical protein